MGIGLDEFLGEGFEDEFLIDEDDESKHPAPEANGSSNVVVDEMILGVELGEGPIKPEEQDVIIGQSH